MTTPNERRYARLAALALLAALAVACGGKRPPALASGGAPPPAEATEVPPAAPVEEGPDVQPVEGEGALGSDIASDPTMEGEAGPLDDVLFALDSAALSDVGRAQLDRHGAWLQGHPEVRATVEGHCDERGTVEYNLALGEQRARTVRDYLVGLGVAGARLRVVSYGKERPVDPAASEEAYARNRRVHFALSR